MITFKCKMCGGDLEFEQGASVAECPYCGTTQTLPKLDDDKRANMYDRANHFRRQNEFDKAMAIYEQILQEDRSDAEAYWSLVLCRYGIEYVEDPVSHKRVPTVNRVQYASILADEDYKSALQYADTIQRGVYEAEANAIAEIQKGILDISKKEKPFDVFICYKETDANGRRTPDSVLANDMYHQLTKEGFKVFFSRITLEDKIGTAYEPYIFAALNSAKVMVVLGTKPEYFNAVWVKNEWSRYLALIRAGADKTLVPAYRDMDPYDLPDEFAHLQAQDMGKLGFMQDLIRGIKKILQKDEQKPQAVTQQSTSLTGNTAPLLERAFMFLEDGDFERADEFCEQVLNLDPKNGRAYLGKLMVALQVRRENDLKNQPRPFDGDSNYQKIMRFGEETLKTQVRQDIEFIRSRNEHDRQKGIYHQALDVLQMATTVEQCLDAKKRFQSIPDYEGTQQKVRECEAKIESIKDERYRYAEYLQGEEKWKEAIEEFEKLGNYRDSYQRAQLCRGLQEKSRKEIEALKLQKQQEDTYKSAKKQVEEKHYEEAIQQFEKLGNYRDSLALIEQCKIAKEEEVRRQEQQAAIEKAKAKAKMRRRVTALLIVAIVVASAVLVYTKIIKPEEQYKKAKALLNEGQYEESYALFSQIFGYKDVDQIINNDEHFAAPAEKAAWRAQFSVGNTLLFGSFEQDNDASNGKEDIEWVVLKNDGITATLISKHALYYLPYYNVSKYTLNTDISWESSVPRGWLNGTFVNAAFTTEERALLQPVETTYNKTDKVYLLSKTEAETLFKSKKARICSDTAYAVAQYGSTYRTEVGDCSWMLRSQGMTGFHVAVVTSDGSIGKDGVDVDWERAIRPVISISLS